MYWFYERNYELIISESFFSDNKRVNDRKFTWFVQYITGQKFGFIFL